jgi:hypothetical protein
MAIHAQRFKPCRIAQQVFPQYIVYLLPVTHALFVMNLHFELLSFRYALLPVAILAGVLIPFQGCGPFPASEEQLAHSGFNFAVWGVW